VDDSRIGRILRALRRRRGWRQVDLAAAAGVAQTTISLIERGHWTALSVRVLRRAFGSVDASFDGIVGWRGGSIDRLLDERHAALVERAVAELQRAGWTTAVEVSFAHYGERGSIDILAIDPEQRAVLVIEIKSTLTSVEETIRRLDVKERLVAGICFDRFGWRPALVGRCLVLPADPTSRRRVGEHRATFASALPGRTRDVLRWLRAPGGRLSAVWFLSVSNPSAGRSVGGGPERVRRRTAVDH
jgi:transcriptional regulator with XRE-family HTH domain